MRCVFLIFKYKLQYNIINNKSNVRILSYKLITIKRKRHICSQKNSSFSEINSVDC